jgi:hypothetical protein
MNGHKKAPARGLWGPVLSWLIEAVEQFVFRPVDQGGNLPAVLQAETPSQLGVSSLPAEFPVEGVQAGDVLGGLDGGFSAVVHGLLRLVFGVASQVAYRLILSQRGFRRATKEYFWLYAKCSHNPHFKIINIETKGVKH